MIALGKLIGESPLSSAKKKPKKPKKHKPRKRRPKDPIVLDPWELQPGEPSKAFSAFKFYRDTPPYKRSLAKCSTAYWGKFDEAKLRQWEKWSSVWKWVERVQTYERYVDAKERRKNEAEISRMREKHAGFSRLLQGISISELQKLQVKINEAKESGAEANLGISKRDLLAFLQASVNIEKAALGDIESLIHLAGIDVTVLTNEQLKQIIEG